SDPSRTPVTRLWSLHLLRCALDRHEAHRRPDHRLADRLGIVGIILVALAIGLHELWTEQVLARNALVHQRLSPRITCMFFAASDRVDPGCSPGSDCTVY